MHSYVPFFLSYLVQVLERLHESCRKPTGEDDPAKGSQLLEIYALKIQVRPTPIGVSSCSMSAAHHTQVENERQNNSELKELYVKALNINGLANPRVTGVIHQCGGKAHMRVRLDVEKSPTRLIPPTHRVVISRVLILIGR